MADHDRKPESAIIGRDADAARDAELLDQLAQTTSESAGGNVSGTAEAEQCEGLDIIFEREELESSAD